MSTQQKDDFQYYLGVACYCKAGFTQNNFFYNRSIKAFDAIVSAKHRDTFKNKIGENLLSDERYKEILYYKISAYHTMYKYEPIIKPTRYFLEACGRDPKTRPYNNPEEKKWIQEVLFIQGNAYEEMHRDDDAISSYEQYLSLNPDDEFVQKNLEALQEKNKSK